MASEFKNNRNILTECLTNSTAHGLSKVVRGKNLFLQLLWSLCFAVCTCYCIYSLVISTREFLKYPSYAKVELVQDKIPTAFPAVTFCNIKNFKKTKVNEYFKHFEERIPLLMDKIKTKQKILMQSYVALSELKSYLLQHSNFSDDVFEKHGYSLSDMLLSCNFNYMACDVDDFVTTYHTLYGNCFTFNSGKYANGSKAEIKKAALQGPQFGFSVEIFTGDPLVETNYEINDGLIVFIQKQDDTLYALSGNRVLIPTGAETEIKIKKNVVYKLPYPHGTCIDRENQNSKLKSPYFDHMVRKKGQTYNQEHCYLLCTQKRINTKCNCSYPELPSMEKVRICESPIELFCLVNIISSFDYIGDDCEVGCPLACKITKYDLFTSRAFYPNKFYKKLLMTHEKLNNSGIAFEDLDQAVLRFSVFYESMVYTKTEEFPSITTETYIANIGGTVGFYLGISILTFVEVVELVFNAINLFYKRFIKKKVEHSK